LCDESEGGTLQQIINKIMNRLLKNLTIICICPAFLSLIINAQIATGGNYTLTKTAIANGGTSGNGASIGGNYSIEGTIGQSAAGTNEQNAIYNFKTGFWTAQPLAPTASSVLISGRILTANGRGIRNVRVTLTAPSGEIRTVISSSFGYFRFDEIAAGETYIFRVFAKRFTFANPTQVITATENLDDVNFVAEQ
jgi:Carboxypeptidase regulatory-like domain